MKKKAISIISFFLIVTSISIYLLNQTKSQIDSYYSKTNAPIFYGLTKAIIKENDEFSLLNPKFRIFARDFEEGDITQKIIATSNVDPTTAGEYTIHYEIVDSDSNKTTLDVPIKVVKEEEENRYYERTLYSLPSVWNMSLAGTNRGNNHDRQILGFYLEANAKIKIKKLSETKDLQVTYLNNDSKTEKAFTITNEYQDITNTQNGVPFIKTPYLEEPVVIGIEVEENIGVHPLPYYYYQDDEQTFFTNWNNLENSYAVIDGEDVTTLVPYDDRNKLINYYNNCHHSLDEYLEYWHQVTTTYDEFLGLSYNPKETINQNVKTKYFFKANAHGAGAAYYAGDHIGINSASVAPIFEVNWGGLHEVGHGYQGSLAHSTMGLGEVSNNILGYYIQKEKEIYPYPGSWLGEISIIEEKINQKRREGVQFNQLELNERLYVLVNLLNTFDAKKTYAEINKNWRRNINNKTEYTSSDIYAQTFYQLYNVNIIPYFEKWGIPVSDKVIKEVKNGKNISILEKGMTTAQKENLTKEGLYSLVNNEELATTKEIGSATLELEIEDITELKGKRILLKDGKEIKQILKIEDNILKTKELPIGIYTLYLPTTKSNTYDFQPYIFLEITKDSYRKIEYKKNPNNSLQYDTEIIGKGLGDKTFFTINVEANEIKMQTQSGMPHSYFSDTYASIQIENTNREIIYQKEIKGNEMLETLTESIPYQFGYKIIIEHKEAKGRLVPFSTSLNRVEEHLKTSTNKVIYTITPYGISKEKTSAYQKYQEKIEAYIQKLQNDLSISELQNKEETSNLKRKALNSIHLLNEPEKSMYLLQYEYLYKGSFPTLMNPSITIPVGEKIDLYEKLIANDLEDGKIELNEQNLILTWPQKLEIGENKIYYTLLDSDANKTTGIIYFNRILTEVPNLPNKKEELPIVQETKPIQKEEIIEIEAPKKEIIEKNLEGNVEPEEKEIEEPKGWILLETIVMIFLIVCIILLQKSRKNN